MAGRTAAVKRSAAEVRLKSDRARVSAIIATPAAMEATPAMRAALATPKDAVPDRDPLLWAAIGCPPVCPIRRGYGSTRRVDHRRGAPCPRRAGGQPTP